MTAGRPFHLMSKPSGPACNLDCGYCFYLDKPELMGQGKPRMSHAVLEAYVRRYIEDTPTEVVSFAWQGGEPTLMGLPFFQEAVRLQALYCPPHKTVENVIQTNGLLLDGRWAEFLVQHDFLVGLSLDGPEDLHDAYRPDKLGQGSWARVMRSLSLLKAHGVRFNTLTVVSDVVAAAPARLYRFLDAAGSRHMQFIPLVERRTDQGLVSPDTPEAHLTERTVPGEAWGAFLCEIFDLWLRDGIGRIYVQHFDTQVGMRLGAGAGMCIFGETCGHALVVEHTGDVYACDHYVWPKWRLGSLTETSLQTMLQSPAQRAFGDYKRDSLPRQCLECTHRPSCHGGCPKNRVLRTPAGEGGLNWLCAGYYRFFEHAGPWLDAMARLVAAGRSASEVQRLLPDWPQPPKKNDPCPCGRGGKYKRCCALRTHP